MKYSTRTLSIAALFLALALVLGLAMTLPQATAAEDGPEYYVIQLTDPPLASYRGGIEGLAPTNPEALGQRKLDPRSPASVAYLEYLDGVHDNFISQVEAAVGHAVEVNFRYTAAYNGVSIWLTPEEADVVAGLPGVQDITRNYEEHLDTDYGPQWIGADEVWDGTATGSPYMGEGVTIGVIDTGANMSHESFAEVGPVDGYVHVNPLGSGNFLGLCVTNPVDFPCNDKLIGYYIYTGETTQDTDGHGSHTASTAGGNVVTATVDITPSNPFLYTPLISGVAPHANIIMYDACVDGGSCPLTGLVAAINQAVLDGVVDVTNYSISGGTNPWGGTVEQAFLGAFDAGIVPVASAGNAGPGPSTLGHLEPWVLTVGASTHNRVGGNLLMDMSGGGSPPADINGAGLGASYGPAPIVYAGDYGDPLCNTVFPAGTWTNGEIVVCDRGTTARVWKGYAVWRGGAGGFVLANDLPSGDSLVTDPHYLPGIQISYDDGVVLKNWLASGSGHMATIQGTVFDLSPSNGDIMASFSSRGPNLAYDGLKPDVTAPGVAILAAYTDAIGPPAPGVGPTWMDHYNFVSGTSMSSPHTAGAAALMVGLYPGWSPAQVKSAIMMGADPTAVLKEDAATPGDPFDYGNGSVRVNRAAQTGLVLDETTADFQAANPGIGGDPKTLNLASMQNSNCVGSCSWTRTVENPTGTTMDWNASVSFPGGGSGSVTPSSFSLAPGASQALTINVSVAGMTLGVWNFGTVDLTETGGNAPDAIMSIAVVPGLTQGVSDIHVDPNAVNVTITQDTTMTVPLSISNVGTEDLTWSIYEDAGPICDAPDDIPWASVSPDNGTTASAATDIVEITLDATGLAPGTYNGNLCVDSNDPAEPLVTVAVSLTVEEPEDFLLFFPIMLNNQND